MSEAIRKKDKRKEISEAIMNDPKMKKLCEISHNLINNRIMIIEIKESGKLNSTLDKKTEYLIEAVKREIEHRAKEIEDFYNR